MRTREKARALFEEAGVSSPFHLGVRSEREVDEELRQLGLIRATVLSVGPGPSLTLAEFLGRLMSGELSYSWNVPPSARERCLPALAAWAETTFDLARLIPRPREIHWAIYRIVVVE